MTDPVPPGHVVREHPRPLTTPTTGDGVSGTTDPVPLVHVGLGQIGLSILSLVQRRPSLRTVAAVERIQGLLDKSVAEVLPGHGPDSSPTADLQAARVHSSINAVPYPGSPAVVIHCTGSALESVASQLLAAVDSGYHVVSTCEELSYPWDTVPELAQQLHDAARDRGVTILGTGVNPGFIMDYLPVVMSAATQDVHRIEIDRVQDVSRRRLSLQSKIGIGMDLKTFMEEKGAGGIGHVGLRESAYGLARALGWKLESVDETVDPIVAEAASVDATPDRPVTGIYQVVQGRRDGDVVVSLSLRMSASGLASTDEIRLFGTPDIKVSVPSGLNGDIVTAAVICNAIPRVMEAQPGLATMFDIRPPRLSV